MEKEKLQARTLVLEAYFREKAAAFPEIKKIKGRGLMLGVEFDFEIATLRKALIYQHHIFTGGSSNKKLIRILPPLTVKEKHFYQFFQALRSVLDEL